MSASDKSNSASQGPCEREGGCGYGERLAAGQPTYTTNSDGQQVVDLGLRRIPSCIYTAATCPRKKRGQISGTRPA